MALLHVDFFSDVLGMCQQMDVILPEQTHGQIGMEGVRGEGKYPVLYLLHGMSDDGGHAHDAAGLVYRYAHWLQVVDIYLQRAARHLP